MAMSPIPTSSTGNRVPWTTRWRRRTSRRQVQQTLVWHINADEPPLYDYNLDFGRDPSLFESATPYRSSDHDPIIVGIDLAQQ